MASEEQDDSQKTEEPTQKRLEDARKKGQVPSSREINHLFILFSFTMILLVFSPYIMRDTTLLLRPFLSRGYDMPMGDAMFNVIMQDVLLDMLLILTVPFVMTIFLALAAGLLQNRFNVSVEPIKPKFEKISPMKGLKRMFSMRSVVEFLKGVLKLTIVGFIAAFAIWPNLEALRLLPNMEVLQILDFLAGLAKKMLIGVLAVMFLIAIGDYLYQFYEYMKNMRMSKQDIKDEYKQQEGDPKVKQRLKQIRMERAQQRMMSNVPDSDVVITNPTHYAVALSYDTASMDAPKVVAMGVDKVALRIRDVAKEHKVTIVRNPPLARALYENAELDEEIPMEHYQAVAEVIGYVYKLQGRKFEKGTA